jgi:hypothetical protein
VALARSAPLSFQGTAKDLEGLVTHGDEAIVTAACKILSAAAAPCLDGSGKRAAKVCESLKVLCCEAGHSVYCPRSLMFMSINDVASNIPGGCCPPHHPTQYAPWVLE